MVKHGETYYQVSHFLNRSFAFNNNKTAIPHTRYFNTVQICVKYVFILDEMFSCNVNINQFYIFKQVGILSFGSDQCGAAGVPSVYTNIKKYATWIRDNLPVIYDN